MKAKYEVYVLYPNGVVEREKILADSFYIDEKNNLHFGIDGEKIAIYNASHWLYFGVTQNVEKTKP